MLTPHRDHHHQNSGSMDTGDPQAFRDRMKKKRKRKRVINSEEEFEWMTPFKNSLVQKSSYMCMYILLISKWRNEATKKDKHILFWTCFDHIIMFCAFTNKSTTGDKVFKKYKMLLINYFFNITAMVSLLSQEMKWFGNHKLRWRVEVVLRKLSYEYLSKIVCFSSWKLTVHNSQFLNICLKIC